jgi:hypothetical protein
MELHFAGTANVFVYYPSLRKARSASLLCLSHRWTTLGDGEPLAFRAALLIDNPLAYRSQI